MEFDAANVGGHVRLPVAAVDWSLREIHVTFDGVAVERMRSVDALLDALDEPHRVVAESTIESWDPARRRALVERVRREGHELLLFRPIHTAKARATLGLKKSHDADVRAIYWISEQGRLHLYPISDRDEEWIRFRERVNREYQRLRLTGEKPRLVEEAKQILGPYRELNAVAQSVLGNGTKYYETLLAAIYFAAGNATSRARFERLLGLHGSAYPSLLRSEVHHHSFRHARKRGVTWQEYRRELRRAFQAFKAARPEGLTGDWSERDPV